MDVEQRRHDADRPRAPGDGPGPVLRSWALMSRTTTSNRPGSMPAGQRPVGLVGEVVDAVTSRQSQKPSSSRSARTKSTYCSSGGEGDELAARERAVALDEDAVPPLGLGRAGSVLGGRVDVLGVGHVDACFPMVTGVGSAVCPSRWSTRISAPPPVTPAPPGELAAGDHLVQREDGVLQRLGPGRAPRGVDVDRHDLVDALDDGVVVEHAAARRAHAHRDDPLRLDHLVVDLPEHRRHLLADPAGDDHEVGLAGRGPEDLHAVAGQVVVRARPSPSSRWRSRRDRRWPGRSTSAGPT